MLKNYKSYIISKALTYFITFCSIVITIFVILIIIIWVFVVKSDNWKYNHSVKLKEDMFQMLIENRNEYEELVELLKVKYEEQNSDSLVISGKEEYKNSGIENELLNKFPINLIGVSPSNGEMIIGFYFKFSPTPYRYWGIYYVENGAPPMWTSDVDMAEKDGVFTQLGSYYKFETEKITDNWYYFQCWTR